MPRLAILLLALLPPAGLLQSRAGPPPVALAGAVALTLGVEDVQAVSAVRQPRLDPRRAEVAHPPRQGGARVTDEVRQLRVVRQHRRPGRARQLRAQLAGAPIEAGGLDQHLNGLAAAVDLVAGPVADLRPGGGVEDRQQRLDLAGRARAEPAQGRHARRALPQQAAQQPLRLRQADADRLGRGGELREAVRIDRNGLGELRFEFREAGVALGDLAAQVLKLGLGGGAINVREGLLGLPVHGLAGGLALVGELLDGTVGAAVDGGGADEPSEGS